MNWIIRHIEEQNIEVKERNKMKTQMLLKMNTKEGEGIDIQFNNLGFIELFMRNCTRYDKDDYFHTTIDKSEIIDLINALQKGLNIMDGKYNGR